MPLTFRYLDNPPRELKEQVKCFASWVRSDYAFPVPLAITLINRPCLIDDDGTECSLRWWQLDRSDEAVKAQVAVGNFATHLRTEGPEVAYPTVIAAIGRCLSYYFQILDKQTVSEAIATAWGDALLDAYSNQSDPPHPNPWLGDGELSP